MLSGKCKRFSGLDFKKLISGMTGIMMITMGMMVIIPMTAHNAEAWMTPDAGLMLTFDDLVMMSGGAIIGAYPSYQLMDPILTIAPSDTVVLMGGEDVFIPPGGMIEVLGGFDGMAGMNSIFQSTGLKGDWMGFNVLGGMFMISGVEILDADTAVNADNTIMTNIDNCLIRNCFTGIRFTNVMGGPQIWFNTIEDCDLGVESTDSSTQMMGNIIRNGIMDGVRLSGWAGPSIQDNDIYNFAMSGITGMNLDGAFIGDNDIYNNQGGGISLMNSHADISNNRIYGWNATPGSGMPGTPGINLFGPSNFASWITQNIIEGGSGDEFMGFAVPDGGHAIWANGYEGNAMGWPQLNISNNFLLKGGNGGVNNAPMGVAGNGGDAIRIDGIPDLGSPPTEALRITNNAQILGGRGGDNNAPAVDGAAGDGGYGIRIIEDDFVGSQEISDNTFIRGGDGGHNFADDLGTPVWKCGDGGDGIYIEDAWMAVPTEMLNNPHVEGGKGGNGTATGSFKQNGMGGNGIHFKAVNNAIIDPTIAFGGDGGDNVGNMMIAGDGGEGILIEAIADRFSQVNILDVNGTGGEGGDNYIAGGPGGGGAGWGGDGLAVDGGSMVFSQGSNYTGGKGGDTYADMDFGGMGGRGIHVWNDSMLNAFVGTVLGGDGGDTRYNGPPGAGSWGGMGGTGVYAHDAMTNFDIVGHYIGGGVGGDNHFDPLGNAGTGGSGVESWSMQMVQLMDSEIMAGPGGTDAVNGVPGNRGTYGVSSNTIAMGAILDNLTVHGADSFGVYFQCDGMLTNSEVYDCGMGATSCGVIILSNSIPFIGDNYVHDCTSGILVGSNSNPEIMNNVVENSQFYGVYVYSNSHPHFDNTTVDQSGEYGMRLIGGTTSLIENCTISNSGIADWYLDQNSHPVSLNTTNDKTVVINDALSDLTMDWFMHTQVVDQFLAPVAGANIWINDTFGGNSGSGVSDAGGWLNWTEVTEFIETQAARTYYTDHNGTAISGMQTGWAVPEPTMDASRDVIIVLGASVYNIFLNQGWNLISIPLIPADTSIDAVLATIAGQWDYIRVYDPLSPEPWLSNASFKPDQLNDFDTLDETQGFWIDITTASATLTVTGTEPVTSNIPLYAGWNLVGYPSFVEMSISAALAGTGYDRPVEGFDISEPYDIKQLSDFDFMRPGEAYWIHVPVDTVWMVENSATPSMPYPVFGFVYLYDGTSAGGYTPLASMGGATVEVTWWDIYNGWSTIMTVTNPIGQYSVDLLNYTDGGIVYVNATFDAPFSNNGYNF